jgi:predicted transcriptional regulator
MTYPKDPGFVSGSETSEHAAKEVESKAGAMRNAIMELVRLRGMFGCTSYEAGAELGMKPQTVSARFAELSQFGWLIKTGRKRVTQGNYKAFVYVTRDYAHLVPKNVKPTLQRLENIRKAIVKLEEEAAMLRGRLNDGQLS